MEIWGDIYDASGNRLGAGPIRSITNATIRRALNGAGTFNARMVADVQTLSLVQNERRLKLWVEDTGGVRLAGEGIIRNVAIAETTNGVVLRVQGPDILDELKRRNTLLARIYNQQTVQAVMSDLISLVPGWSVVVDSSIQSDIIDARFDGVSVLSALQEITKRYGFHMRYSNTASQTLVVGPLGDDNGLRISKVEYVTSETLVNPSLLMVESLDTSDNTEELVNWVLPLGAGEGVAALTLAKSDRITPYTISSTTGPDGTTLYYIADSASVSSNGEIRKVMQFKEIAPLSNSDTDIRNAANALYDAAVEYIQRYKDRQEVYSVSLHNAKENVLPGDKVHMDYVSQFDYGGTLTDVLSVRGDYWILSVTETLNLEGASVQLEISNVDRRMGSVVETVHNTIEQVNLRGLKPQITPSIRSYVYDREIDDTYSAIVPIEFTDAVMELQRVRLRIKTSPFRSTAGSAAAGGDHDHLIAPIFNSDVVGGPSYTTKYISQIKVSDLNAGAHTALGQAAVSFKYYFGTPPANPFWKTYESSGTHTHALTYGIADDSQHPQQITIEVNGSDETLALTGSASLAPSNAAIDTVVDAGELTNLILNASGGLRQVHEIEIKAAAGQGRVEVTVEIFEVTQAIKLS